MNSDPGTAMNDRLRIILAILIGVVPVNLFMIWYRLSHDEAFTLSDMLVYPLVVGGANILLIVSLNKYLLKQSLKEFNTGRGTWYWDILSGLALTAVCFMLMFLERLLVSGILPQGPPPSREVLNLMTGLAQNPLLLAVWLGPVVWIGVALFEEMIRVFFLSCLWKISQARSWAFFSIFLISVYIGFVHFYQGAFGIVSISIQGLVMAGYYYRFRRFWPLVISHALYDSIQIVLFVIQIQPQG